MKTYILTEQEIREIVAESYIYGTHYEYHRIDFSKLKESQPSISAEEFLKDFTDVSETIHFDLSDEENYSVFIDKNGKEYSLSDLLTEYLQRQGKVVEIKKEVECGKCKMLGDMAPCDECCKKYKLYKPLI